MIITLLRDKFYRNVGSTSLNFIRLLRVVITPSEEKTTRSNRMNFRLRINQINIGRHYYLNFYLHDTVVINVFQDGPYFLAMNGELISLRLRLYLYRVTMGFLPEPQYRSFSLSRNKKIN